MGKKKKLSPSEALYKTSRGVRPELPESCVVCCDEKMSFVCIFPCNHVDMCSLCALRLRLLNKDLRCVHCQTPSEYVIIAKRTQVFSYDAYFKFDGVPKDVALREDEDLKIFFTHWHHRDSVVELEKLNCRICDVKGLFIHPSLSSLKKHYEIEHRKFFCELCLESKPVFLANQILYTPKELDHHNVLGDLEDPEGGRGVGGGRKGKNNSKAFKGHPFCDFCGTHFYEDRDCYRHLRKKHEICYLCEQLKHTIAPVPSSTAEHPITPSIHPSIPPLVSDLSTPSLSLLEVCSSSVDGTAGRSSRTAQRVVESGEGDGSRETEVERWTPPCLGETFYRDAACLERHHKRDHFCCFEPGCKERKLEVWGTLTELNKHNAAVHKKNFSLSEFKQNQLEHIKCRPEPSGLQSIIYVSQTLLDLPSSILSIEPVDLGQRELGQSSTASPLSLGPPPGLDAPPGLPPPPSKSQESSLYMTSPPGLQRVQNNTGVQSKKTDENWGTPGDGEGWMISNAKKSGNISNKSRPAPSHTNHNNISISSSTSSSSTNYTGMSVTGRSGAGKPAGVGSGGSSQSWAGAAKDGIGSQAAAKVKGKAGSQTPNSKSDNSQKKPTKSKKRELQELAFKR